ncbi:acyl-CoA thioesterase II [Mycolicibacterium sp. 018/SC-01/001]|uniref:acyl-CoA thioesterase n=1 Tax=Mycolicibacterium sp. 018/SC-01/001 TaxID=2592069 RepID=UPI00118054C2|nr:acyl-CoA thioesterase domain-containing protein [Mycolicibacterium sp. 018/SC-01/001]TRW89046.1 acyl-CoA thioesterase II [Mycolicibacterium sp. 018/SC-01/001]
MSAAPASSLPEVLASLELTHVDGRSFSGEQLPAPANHILGAHISAQALLAASRTAPDRAPHSMHVYFLRPGDARRPVRFDVVDLQEGRTFSARRVTARQDDQILLEAMSSFTALAPGSAADGYQPALPDVVPAEALPPVPPHLAESSAATAGQWASLRWFQRRIIDEESAPPARTRIWWRPAGHVPDRDPALTAALVAYLSAATLTEPVFRARGRAGTSLQRDHSVWFHAPADLSDWLLYDQCSPSSTGALALGSGSMFNRDGRLVCTVRQELYFAPPRP